MPSFTQREPEQKKSDRKLIGFFFEVEGKFGTFHKAFIDGKAYYLSATRKLDKNGKPYLMFTEGEKVENRPQGEGRQQN